MSILFNQKQSYIGIDIGSSSIKVVELRKDKEKVRLLTYGFSESKDYNLKNDWPNNPALAAEAINEICRQAGVNSRSGVSALPTFSVFSSILNLSNVSPKDLASAVHWEAKKVVPLPLEEMILDWKKIENEDESSNNLKVLLTGAPKTLVKKYIDIFKLAKINLSSLETETFSLIRSLLGNDKSTVMIVKIGAKTTDIAIVNKGIPMLSRSLDIGGYTITKKLSGDLKISLERAEQFKYDLGLSSFGSEGANAPKAITLSVEPIVNEIKFAMNLFHNKNPNRVEKIILTGGSAVLADLVNYLSKLLDMKVIIGDPWAHVSYPEELSSVLNEIGPQMAVAIGLAMREVN